MNYVPTRLSQSLFVSSVISIHYFEYTAQFSYEGESHDFWELIFCDKGRLKINAGNEEYVLERGQAFLHPPRQFHSVRSEGGRSANSIILSFNSDTQELYRVADSVILTDKYVATSLFSILREAKYSFENELGKLHEARLIRKDSEEQFASEQIIQNYIELLLIHLIRKETKRELPSDMTPDVRKSALVDSIVAYMKENIDSKITFTDLTKRFSVSSTTLKKLFGSTFGHGAMEHLTRMRVEYSKELLRDGKHSCTDIAAMCGFCSVHHYSGVFRKYELMSPTEYVKSIKSMLEEKS